MITIMEVIISLCSQVLGSIGVESWEPFLEILPSMIGLSQLDYFIFIICFCRHQKIILITPLLIMIILYG